MHSRRDKGYSILIFSRTKKNDLNPLSMERLDQGINKTSLFPNRIANKVFVESIYKSFRASKVAVATRGCHFQVNKMRLRCIFS
jgi:hypothetical protein